MRIGAATGSDVKTSESKEIHDHDGVVKDGGIAPDLV